MRAFLFAFPTEQAAIVGQQITLPKDNAAQVSERIDLLVERALVTEPVPICDLVVKGVIDGQHRGYLLNDQGLFVSDKQAEAALTLANLKALTAENHLFLTFTCAPWGSGRRMAIDRDNDGVLDSDELIVSI